MNYRSCGGVDVVELGVDGTSSEDGQVQEGLAYERRGRIGGKCADATWWGGAVDQRWGQGQKDTKRTGGRRGGKRVIIKAAWRYIYNKKGRDQGPTTGSPRTIRAIKWKKDCI